MSNQTRRLPLMAVLFATVTLILSACGGDDTTDSASETTDDATQFCEAVLKIETVPEPDIDFEALSPDQQKAEAKKFASEKLKPLTPAVVAAAPTEIKASVDKLVAAVDEVAASGDFEAAFGTPDVDEADKTTHAYEVKNCGWGVQNLTAADYAFQGITPQVKAGPTSFDLRNIGKEMHELNIIKKKDGVTDSFEDLLKLPEDQARAKTERVGGIDPTKPGDSDYVVVNLAKGEYLVACFLPVGATPELFAKVESGDAKPPEGPPHASKGMTAIITVT